LEEHPCQTYVNFNNKYSYNYNKIMVASRISTLSQILLKWSKEGKFPELQKITKTLLKYDFTIAETIYINFCRLLSLKVITIATVTTKANIAWKSWKCKQWHCMIILQHQNMTILTQDLMCWERWMQWHNLTCKNDVIYIMDLESGDWIRWDSSHKYETSIHTMLTPVCLSRKS